MVKQKVTFNFTQATDCIYKIIERNIVEYCKKELNIK